MAGSNQFGTWTDADEKAVETARKDFDTLQDITGGGGQQATNFTAAQKAYAYEKGYIKAPYDDAILREARKQQIKEKVEEGKEEYPTNPLTFGDISGQMPRQAYANSTSLNFSAKQRYTSHYLDFSGTVAGIDIAQYVTGISARYPLNQVIETLSGHVIEYNDTPENPRILIKHTSGSGIDMRPDGTIVVSSHGDGKVEVNHGGHKLVVTGDGQLHFSGDLTLNVGGDFNVNVGGSFNVQAKEETKTINGASRDLYFGNKYTSIVGSRQDFMTENHTSAALGFRDTYTKGDHKIATEGGGTIAMKGGLSVSSEAQITQSAPDINIAAESISVFGATGNIGGEGVIMHNYNMFTGHSVHAGDTVKTQTVNASERVNASSVHADRINATSFHGYFVGDLDGTAKIADLSGSFTSQSAASNGGTVLDDNAGINDKATSAVMSEYLYKGGYGIQKIFIDKGDHLKGAYDKTRDTGGVTRRILTTAETRAKLRDAGHRENSKFGNHQASSGVINPKYNNPAPSSIAYSIDPKNTTITGRNTIEGAPDPKVRVKADINLTAPISVDPRFDPKDADQILASTKLARGISLSQFLYGKGDKGKLDPTLRIEQKKQLVRNLIPQANLVQRVRDNQDIFKGYNLDIIEGVYVKEPQEVITADGILDLRTQGRAVVYEVIGPNGIIDKDKTFDLAVWLANNIRYDKIILDYDELDPRGMSEDVNVQIIVIMPQVAEDFTADFKMETETLFNNRSQGREFIKIGDKITKIEKGSPDNSPDLPDNDATDEPSDETQDGKQANTRTTGGPEDLSGKFKTEAEVIDYIKQNKLNVESNGYSFTYNGKQRWLTINPVTLADDPIGSAFISDSYESFKENQGLYGPVSVRNQEGKDAYEAGIW
jgi:hypothetical protein